MEPSGASQGQRGALTFTREPRTEPPVEPAGSTPGAAAGSTRQSPPALSLALILNSLSGIAISLRLQLAWPDRTDFGDGFQELFTRWNMLSAGLAVALLSLGAAGAAELVRRSSDLAKRGAQLVLVGLLALIALSFFYYYTFYKLQAQESFERMEALHEWTRQLRSTSWNVITLGAVLVSWRERRGLVLIAALAVSSLLANPYDFYGRPLYDLFAGQWGARIAGWAFDFAHAALLVAVLRRGAPLVEARGGWERAAVALDRTASALYARLWISAASITLVMLSYNRGGSGLAKLWMIGVPLGVAVANLVAVGGIFSAGALTVDKAPRRSLHAAATLLMMATFLSAMQMFRLFHSWPDVGEVAKALPVATPVIAALALCALAEGLVRLAALLPSIQVAQQAETSRLIVILSQLTLLGVQYYMTASPPREPGSFVLLLVCSVGATVVALVSQARLCRAVAAQIRERNELPSATVIAS